MTNTLDYEKLRTQIRIRRVRNHWRQADLAERIDVTPAYISRIETGKDRPSLGILYRMSQAFECTVDDLIRADGQESGSYLIATIKSRAEKASDPQRCKILRMIELLLAEDVSVD